MKTTTYTHQVTKQEVHKEMYVCVYTTIALIVAAFHRTQLKSRHFFDMYNCNYFQGM